MAEEADFDDDAGVFDWRELAPTLGVYSITFALGLIGNILIVIATYRYRKMQSVTNVLLASLATADLLLVVVCIPVKLAKLFSYTWTLGEFLCKSVHYVQNVSAICSVLTLTAISIERYYAILHPMRSIYICTVSQVRKVIAVTWILAIILATPILFMQKIRKVGSGNQTGYWCVKHWDQNSSEKAHEIYMLLLVLVIPTMIMSYAYKMICCEIWKVVELRYVMTSEEALSRNSTSVSQSECVNLAPIACTRSWKQKKDEKKSVKQVIHMLVAVVVLFAICWAPLLIVNVLTVFEILPTEKVGPNRYIKTAFELMAYFNSCINPIIYGFMSKNFRDSCQSALCCFSRRWERQGNTTNYSTRTSRSSMHTKHTVLR